MTTRVRSSLGTLPNHTTMMTGRPTEQPAGQANTVQHGYTGNQASGRDVTLHNSGNPHCTLQEVVKEHLTI